jgi:ATP-dependent protease ClpP protease subunit
MNKLVLNLVYLLFLFALPANAAGLRADRTLFISTVITGVTLKPLAEKMDAFIITADKETSPITIILSSPGGEVTSGMSFLNKMLLLRSQQITINCYVLDMAASMAFQILTQCSNRYALNSSFLLWHGVRVGTNQPITEELAGALHEDLSHFNKLILSQLDGSLSLPPDTVRHHFLRETLWSGSELSALSSSFIEAKDSLPEIAEVLRSNQVTRSASPSFGFFDINGTLYYSIWSPYEFMLLGGNNK